MVTVVSWGGDGTIRRSVHTWTIDGALLSLAEWRRAARLVQKSGPLALIHTFPSGECWSQAGLTDFFSVRSPCLGGRTPKGLSKSS